MTADAPPDAAAIAEAFGLAGQVGGLHPVPGAWSHRVYRLWVGSRSYAVKEMRDPWHAANWREWLDEASAFELLALQAGVAAPEPVPARDGGCLADVPRAGGNAEPCPVRLHRWVDGVPAPVGPAAPHLARWAGRTLATMHALRVSPKNRAVFPHLNTDNAQRWPELVEQVRRRGASWAEKMAEATPVVLRIAELATAAGEHVDEEVMTHGDVDQKNVLLANGSPLLCDWDVAAPLIPRRELADVALSMGGWERMDIAREVVGEYRVSGGQVENLTPLDIAPSMMTGVDWVVLNIERAARLREVTHDEAELGESLAPNLLRRLTRSLEIAERMGEIV